MNFLGAIIGIANTQAWTPPTSGQVKNGWTLCSGQTFASLGTVGVNYHASFSGNVANINDSRFIMGTTTTGVSGGSNSVTLISSNMPSLSASSGVSVDHSHYVSGNLEGDAVGNHTHPMWTGGIDRNHRHYIDRNVTNFNAGPHYVVAPEAAHNATTSGPNTYHYHTGASGDIDTNHTHGGTFGTNNNTTAHTHNIGSASPTAINNTPTYLSCYYIMGVLDSIDIPVGTIVPIGNASAWSLPASGAVKNGWALCNGQTFASLGTVGVNYHASLSGSLPNISDSRFAMGNSSTYTTGGSSSVTLLSANIPTITSNDENQRHSHSGTIATATVNTGHLHGSGMNATGAHTHTYGYIYGALYAGATTAISNAATSTRTTSGIAEGNFHYHAMGNSAANGPAHSYSAAGSTVSVGSRSVAHTHGFGTASPTAYSNLPKYISCVYICKVQ